MGDEKGYFVLADPRENERELAELAKTKEGARAIRNFERNYKLRKKLTEANGREKLSQVEDIESCTRELELARG